MRHAALALQRALKRHMDAHILAYGGTDHIKPKHHWLYDVAAQWLQQPSLVLDAFIIERLHLRVKRIADNVHNTSTFELSVLSRLVCVQEASLRQSCASTALVGPSVRLRDGPVTVADSMLVSGLRLDVDDVVIAHTRAALQAGRIVACLREDENNNLHAVLEMLVFDQRLSPSSARWRESGQRLLVSANLLEPSLDVCVYCV